PEQRTDDPGVAPAEQTVDPEPVAYDQPVSAPVADSPAPDAPTSEHQSDDIAPDDGDQGPGSAQVSVADDEVADVTSPEAKAEYLDLTGQSDGASADRWGPGSWSEIEAELDEEPEVAATYARSGAVSDSGQTSAGSGSIAGSSARPV